MSTTKPNRTAHERSPLLNGEESSSTLVGDGDSRSVIRRRSGALAFFFNSKYTPGLDSDTFIVRWLAYSWHVTKVTLLSSMLPSDFTRPLWL